MVTLGRMVTVAAGLCGALFVGYCVHFDRKRRSDPDFKTRLRERRRKQKEAKEEAELSKIPDLRDPVAVQSFYQEQLQLGEELLAQGDFEKGVDHITNVIAVCPQPQQAVQLKLIEQYLPSHYFQRLLKQLPTVSRHFASAQCRKQRTAARERAELVKHLNLKDATASMFLLEELWLGGGLVAQGDLEKGLEHLISAIAVSPDPQQKRRSNPDFKTRLRERRRKQKEAKEEAKLSKIPDLRDPVAVQSFYQEQLQLGEELLAQGDYEKGVDHITNAIAVYPQPQQSTEANGAGFTSTSSVSSTN